MHPTKALLGHALCAGFFISCLCLLMCPSVYLLIYTDWTESVYELFVFCFSFHLVKRTEPSVGKCAIQINFII